MEHGRRHDRRELTAAGHAGGHHLIGAHGGQLREGVRHTHLLAGAGDVHGDALLDLCIAITQHKHGRWCKCTAQQQLQGFQDRLHSLTNKSVTAVFTFENSSLSARNRLINCTGSYSANLRFATPVNTWLESKSGRAGAQRVAC